jgi:uncharacterized membrane protein required for colicin V production
MFMAGMGAALKGLTFNYFDGIIVLWLAIGIYRGRTRGMTQEVLPMFQWILIMVLAGFLYAPLASAIFHNTAGAFNKLWSNVTAYTLIGFAIHLFFVWLKSGVNDKLTGSDYFGGAEYSLGMMAGLLRFACIIVVMIALMNSRVYTQADLAEDAKAQKKSFEDIRFPTYMSVQYAILKESFTGRMVEAGLHPLLIASTTANKPAETLGQRRDDSSLNAILGAGKR